MPTKTERVSAEGDPDDIQRLVAEAVESHLRRLVVGLLDLHDQPDDGAALVQVRSEAQAVASALLTVDLDHLSSAARAISDTLDSLAAGGGAVPTAAVVALLDATAGLRALVAARGQPDSPAARPDALERELAALTPWHPVTAAIRAASGGAALAAAPVSATAGPDEATIRRAETATRERLRVVPGIDLRSAAERLETPGAADPRALADVLGGLAHLADVLVRTTAALHGRLAELANLPELAELDAAVQALAQPADGDRLSAADRPAAVDRRR